MPFNVRASWRTLLAACTSAMPVSNVMISCNACSLAAAADAGQAVMPSNVRSKPGIRLADSTRLRVQNSADPDIEIDGGKLVAAFNGCTASAMRPAQPVPPEPLGFAVCIWITWSACENKLVGTLADPARYCCLSVGCTSIPTLATTASFCWVHSGAIEVRPSLSPYCVPSRADTGNNLVLPSGSASDPRMFL